jgi:hypothetical protein
MQPRGRAGQGTELSKQGPQNGINPRLPPIVIEWRWGRGRARERRFGGGCGSGSTRKREQARPFKPIISCHAATLPRCYQLEAVFLFRDRAATGPAHAHPKSITP